MNIKQKSEYGKLLTRIIKENNMTQSEFYNKLGIKKPYFYDIIGGKINPPPPETQLKIIKLLKPNEEDTKRLLEIGAKIRNEIPADILLYLKTDINSITDIRESESYKRIMEVKING